jgi:uncharacterized membrane protein YdbT with pleckstrin-like domain
MIRGYPFKLRQSLSPNEQIIFEANPHWLFLFISIGQILLFFFLYLFFACPFIGFISNTLKDYCILSASLILFFLSLIFYLEWKFNRLYLTNFRLIRERGIIGKRLMSIRLNDIEDIVCTYGICGRIFGYGDLIIESAGTHGIMAFKGIPRPKRVKLLIERQMLYSEIRPHSDS